MIKYITYNKRKFPFVISFSTLIEFEERTGKEFITMFSSETDMGELGNNLKLMLELGLKTGYKFDKPGIVNLIINLLFSGTKIGINKKNYAYVVDQQWRHLLKIIPEFFYDLNSQGEQVAEEELSEMPVAEKKN